jgi:hypothetical protein
MAMGNASSEVKTFAEWVVGTNDEAGVAEAAHRLLMMTPGTRTLTDVAWNKRRL